MNYIMPPDAITSLVFHDFIDENTGQHNQMDFQKNFTLVCGVDFYQPFSPTKLGVVSREGRLYHRIDQCGKLDNEWGLIHPSLAAKMSSYIHFQENEEDNDTLRYYIEWSDEKEGEKKKHILEIIDCPSTIEDGK